MVESMIGEQPYKPDPEKAEQDREALRRQLDTCLGCHWAKPENPRPVTISMLADCSQHPGVNLRLHALRRRGVVTSFVAEQAGRPRVFFVPAETEKAREYVEQLPHGDCLTNESNPPRPKTCQFAETDVPGATIPQEITEANVAAEAFVISVTEARRPLDTRRHLIGCLACHLSREATVTNSGLAQCAAQPISVPRAFLRALCEADILTIAPRDNSWQVAQYSLADTEQAHTFSELAVPPAACSSKVTRQLQAEQQLAPPSVQEQQLREIPGLSDNGD